MSWQDEVTIDSPRAPRHRQNRRDDSRFRAPCHYGALAMLMGGEAEPQKGLYWVERVGGGEY